MKEVYTGIYRGFTGVGREVLSIKQWLFLLRTVRKRLKPKVKQA